MKIWKEKLLRVQQLQQQLAGTDLDEAMLEVQQGSSKLKTKVAVFTMETAGDFFWQPVPSLRPSLHLIHPSCHPCHRPWPSLMIFNFLYI